MFAGPVSSPRIANLSFNYNEIKTQFWGICCESGKQYSQVVEQRYHITMAVLDPKSFYKDEDEKIVSLMVLRGGCEYLLCVLKHGEIYQVKLNLIFDKGEDVVFYISGHGKVCLSGYQIIDTNDVSDEISSQLKESRMSPSKMRSARAAEIPKSLKFTPDFVSQKIGKTTQTAKKNISPLPEKNTPSKVFWNAFVNDEANGEIQVLASDDEEDDDFSIGNEEDTDSEEDIDSDEEDLKDEVEDLETEVQFMHSELEYLKDDKSIQIDDNEDTVPKSKVSQKRKKKLTQEQEVTKRAKTNDSASKPSGDDNPDIICIGENENSRDSSDFDPMNSSIGNTPMPKKPVAHKEASVEKKKKKKKLKGGLNVSQNSTEVQVSNSNSFSKGSFKMLQNGVEIQDVKIGPGPTAVPGKMVHVYYLARLENNEVFDSRLPDRKPFSFKLGAEQVIRGWEVGIDGMKVGGKRKIRVPPSMGYGKKAIEGIPANSTLNFVVELKAVN